MLAPLSGVGAAITAHRVAQTGWHAPVPVICCGNATVGGAGKTTVAIDLAHRLTARGIAVHILLRGYGGVARGARRVQPDDTAAVTGDEALLLAAVAPTWTGADRAASAQAAVAAGAEVLLMDDGLQNPSLEKTIALLVVDGVAGFGNGRVLPAGPLREPIAVAAARCRAAVLIGPDVSGAVAALPPGLPVLRAALVQDAGIAELCGRRVLAFAGIAFPEKFFAGLERAGVIVADRAPFADHHAFTGAELGSLVRKAREMDAVLVTTPKDAVRLPAGANVHVVNVRLEWENVAGIEGLLNDLVVSGRG
jgi:tetraacyldisaccharide 4'-kinase